MAPIDLLYRLKDYYTGHNDKDLPVIEPRTAALLSILFTLIYVLPFYLFRATRPSPSLNRDAPTVIRARIRTVTGACIVASISAIYILIVVAKADPLEATRLLGWWPIRIPDIARCCFLTLLLYIGPLFEKVFIDRDFDDFRSGRAVFESLSSWIGYRNYVAGPFTEEVIFRSVLIPLHLLAKIPPSKIVFLTPLYFGIAHIHHFYEFTLTHTHTPLLPAFLRSVFQFTYTTLFGWFASFLYLRTGSIYACIIVHAFCNWGGLPRFWGKVRRRNQHGSSSIAMVRGKDDADAVSRGSGARLELGWTVAYYLFLLCGAYSFYIGFWPLTESNQALASFARSKKA